MGLTADASGDVQPDDAEPAGRPTLRPSPGPIAAEDSFGAAGRKAMWPHAERLLRFEAVVRDPTRTDDLKRYRVAVRRLRAALRLFADAYPDRRVRSLRGALGDLGRAAGGVRDLDVRIDDLDRWVAEPGGEAAEPGGEAAAGVLPLRAAWQADRERAAVALARRLETRRHQRLLRDLVAFVDEGVRLTPTGDRSVRGTIASRLWTSFERLREAGGSVPSAELSALHALRIDAKRLRYGLEFLADVLPPSRLPLVGRLVALQDHLGALNDAALAAAATRSFLADRGAALEPREQDAIAAYAARRERDVAELRRTVARPWAPIESEAFARRLGRSVVVA